MHKWYIKLENRTFYPKRNTSAFSAHPVYSNWKPASWTPSSLGSGAGQQEVESERTSSLRQSRKCADLTLERPNVRSTESSTSEVFLLSKRHLCGFFREPADIWHLLVIDLLLKFELLYQTRRFSNAFLHIINTAALQRILILKQHFYTRASGRPHQPMNSP